MGHLALGLVLISACLHASWNYLAKRAGNSAAFVWLFSALSALIYLPLLIALILLGQAHLRGLQYVFVLGTAILHVAYFLLLQRGYRVGDLSLVYPLARGTGPLLSTGAAMLLFGERPTLAALFGIALIISGVAFLVGNPLTLLHAGLRMRPAIGYALLTGIFIASYTLWDKYAVSTLQIPPLLLDASSNILRALILTPFVIGQRNTLRESWQRYSLEALGVAILSPLAYILILFALTMSPVSHVAPLRECSVLIGTLLGARLLSEGHKWQRLGAAGIIMLGSILLALN
ncbi:EamA family transporter [Ktedonosporobacter rubrisoli]|uniref:EamA family transporter n=1 Tax=Ktedonosporobacter rubrisoli TaxID=2509675 RepID=A0A4V0YYL0_KTERU|nr:DMT family transporter [Ktedonosporobacter rubrisoli]QBD76591.1 EamA family transporter [Ktedonosporobacter rubrisoli]